MPQGVEVWVDEGFATIVPDRENRAEVLNSILEHTPVALVEKQTRSGPRVGYRIPEGNAREAGLLDDATEGRTPHKFDQHFAAELVDADPQVSDRGGQHGEYRSPMAESTVRDLAYQAMPTASGHGVQDGDLNFTEPTDANGIVTGPLRPNKNVDDSVPERPDVATPSAAELQVKIRENTPRPADYAPEREPLFARVPRAIGTIATVVDREPAGPAEPASGIGVGPQAGRILDANDFERMATYERGNAVDAAPAPREPSASENSTVQDVPESTPEVPVNVPAPEAQDTPAKRTVKKAAAKKAPAKKAPAKKATAKKGTTR